MRHTSLKLDTPCEFINLKPVNPLISRCEIKVCYVGDTPNRNRSVITKAVAIEMANSLPGSPIVGFFNETKGDFEEHNRMIDISNGQLKFKDTTRPYGFVDLNAKVWFQKFLDDNREEREYLMTEGYLWTEQYSEAKRVLAQGNNQSMELDNGSLKGTWAKDANDQPEFFIINEAIISKLCILGDDVEPCFEGATVTAPTIEFSFDNSFKEQMFSMMTELKQLIKEGGAPVFSTYAVEIGDALWSSLYNLLEKNFPRDLKEGEEDCYRCSKYSIDSVWEEGTQKFAILKDRNDGKLYRLDFTWSESNFNSEATLIEVEKDYVPVSEEPTFALTDVEKFEEERYAVQDNSDEENTDNFDNTLESDANSDNNENDSAEQNNENQQIDEPVKPVDSAVTYKLDEIPEYVELLNKYTELNTNYSDLKLENEKLTAEIEPLKAFKNEAEKKDKQAMIDSFYMLSDSDKAEVIQNIDTYSVDDIEAKLSIICVRNKVSFNLDEDSNHQEPTTYNLNNDSDDYTPAWIKSIQSVAKDMK